MDLLAALKFVSGAVAKSDYMPALQHVAIGGGYVTSFNGTVALCAPVVLDLAACPRADIFAKAIAACTEPTQLHLTEQGLAVQSGSLRVVVPCTKDTFPRVFPEGYPIQLGTEFLAALEALEPLVSTDTSRQWSNGVLLRGASAYATNNVVLCEYWLGSQIAMDINLPLPAVRELIHIGEAPVRLQVAERSATFHFADGRWLRTSLYPTSWPQALTSLLGHTDAEVPTLPAGFFAAVEQLAPFADGNLYVLPDCLATTTSRDLGARVIVPGLHPGPTDPRFAVRQLRALDGLAAGINFSDYPQPCRFVGMSRTRGVILGIT